MRALFTRDSKTLDSDAPVGSPSRKEIGGEIKTVAAPRRRWRAPLAILVLLALPLSFCELLLGHHKFKTADASVAVSFVGRRRRGKRSFSIDVR